MKLYICGRDFFSIFFEALELLILYYVLSFDMLKK